MAKQLLEDEVVSLDREELVRISKPLFYGYVFMAGVSLSSYSSTYAGTLLGLSGLASLTFVSAALSQSVKDGWRSFLDLISVVSLLMVVLFGSYTAAALSLGF